MKHNPHFPQFCTLRIQNPELQRVCDLADCPVCHYRLRRSNSAFRKTCKALISGMTDFAHLNGHTLLANFKSYMPASVSCHLGVFYQSFNTVITECYLLFDPQSWTKITFSQYGTMWLLKSIAVIINVRLPIKKQPS